MTEVITITMTHIVGIIVALFGLIPFLIPKENETYTYFDCALALLYGFALGFVIAIYFFS